MAKRTIEEFWADDVADTLAERGLPHLRVRRHGDLLIVESGPRKSSIPHVRFRRETVHLWRLEIADHVGMWEMIPLRDQLDRLVTALLTNFPWTLEPRE